VDGEVKTPATRRARPRGGAAIFAAASLLLPVQIRACSFRALSPSSLQLVREIATAATADW
jgi:hypothetical protein